MNESGFTLSCGRDDCEAPWFSTRGPTTAGEYRAGEKPESVTCANGHTFAVLDMRITPGGPTAYKLGPEIPADNE
jgi:hypothetical protein